MTKPGFRFNWYFVTAVFTVFFAFTINRVETMVNHTNALFQASSLNTWLFYTFNEGFFLQFDFHNIHPYFLLITVLSKAVSFKYVFIFLSAILALLVFIDIRKRKPGIFDFLLLLSSVALASSDSGVFFLLWIQLLLFRNFKKYKIPVIFLMSLIYLPGFFLFLFIEAAESIAFKKPFGDLKALDVIQFLKPYAWAFLLVLVLQAFLAMVFFDIKFQKLPGYLLLPAKSQLSKIGVNNLTNAGVLFDYLASHKAVAFLVLYVFLAAYFIENRDIFWFKVLSSGILMVIISVFFPFSIEFWIVFVSVFLLGSSVESGISREKQTFLAGGMLMVILVCVADISRKTKNETTVQGENIVISLNDFNEVHFKMEGMRTITLVDLKIIPDNARILLDDTRSGKIEPIINPYIQGFLDTELAYGENLLKDMIEKNKPWVICLKSRIHPEAEQPPFRRVYYLWAGVKNSGSRILLF